MTIIESEYYTYLHGGLLHDRYERVKNLNEGSFGIVSIAKDIKDDGKLVAVKYNTGRLSDFEAYQSQQKNQTHQSKGIDIKSISLNSKTKSVMRTNSTYSSNSQNVEKDVSKSIVLRETKQEILMLKKVDSHPNITKLIDSFDTFMILEYAPRGDLHDAIQLGIAPVATRDVIDVFMQLISAVEFCHKNGVYHRDIKPENILIAEDWSIKLTDFGLATDHLICNDFDVGSERYMAPELLEHSDIDSYAADKVDIWALGICLLNIVFGKSPFRSASSQDKMFLHFAANRETLFDIFPFMSYDLFSVMIHSLTIDPANRDLEMIKRALLNIDVLTYDYEFEEEVDDIKDKPLVEEIEEDENNEHNQDKQAHQPQDDGDDNDKENKENIINNDPIINNDHIINNEPIINKPTIHIENLENNMEDNNSSSDSRKVYIDNKENVNSNNDNKPFSIPTSKLLVNRDAEHINSIDTLVEEGDSESTIAHHSVSKPITIGEKYEPPHRLLSNNSLSRYKNEFKKTSRRYNNIGNSNNKNNYNYNYNYNYNHNNNNNNNNNNHRARRWNPAHRKPLRIANYNVQDVKNATFKEETFDFNRKDFFTPKSVFSNYMEKANRGKQQLQQRSAYYRKYKDFENSLSFNHNGSHKHHNNYNNNYYSSNYGDRRAWQKRKRRSSHIMGNNNSNNFNFNNNKNKGSYRTSNIKSKNSRNDGMNRSHNNNNDQSFSGPRRLSSNISNLVRLSSSMRSSIDGKYVPPNVRLTAAQLMGSAIYSDDEYEPEIDHAQSNKLIHNDDEVFDSGDTEEDDYEDDTFSFELDQPILSHNKNKLSDGRMFQQIQSHAINILSKQITDSKIFDDKNHNSRDASLATTVSNNYSSIGSNLDVSPKSGGYKKYVPPHHRRNSHGADAMDKPKMNINMNMINNNTNIHFNYRFTENFLTQISSSAPTKSSSFFNASSRMVNPHELLSNNDFDHSDGQHSDDLFDIEEK